jgi:Divergent InlB B-repeat domain
LLVGCSHSGSSGQDLAIADLSVGEDLSMDLASEDLADAATPDLRPPLYTLTVAVKSGVYGASGSIVSDVGGVSCPGVCSAAITAGDSVTLTASPSPGAVFQSWSGGSCADPFAAACVTGPLSGNEQLTASFRPAVNYVFITSKTIMPSQIGSDLSGADLLCDQRAKAAGLWNTNGSTPTRFKAWLATTAHSATSRLAGARGWIRVDGREFADDLVSHPSQSFYPVGLDENGTASTDSPITGTADDGTALFTTPSNNGNCDDFTFPLPTPSPTSAMFGDPTASNSAWTADELGLGWCTLAVPIYCFESAFSTTRVSPSPTPSPGGLRGAFVTFWTPGGGLASADAECQADKGGMPGNYLALLATTTSSAASRFTDGQPWARADGVLVAATAADLLAGNWLAPIIVQSDGTVLQNLGQVFGGAKTLGAMATTSQDSCGDWGSTSGNGIGGYASSTTEAWDGDFSPTCNAAHLLYCLQQ